MSPIADKDKYVVYKWIDEGRALFTLFNRDHDLGTDRPELMREIAMDPAEISDDIEYEDHFWVELDDEGEITALEPAPEMHEQMKEDYQEAAEIFDEWQKRDRQNTRGD